MICIARQMKTGPNDGEETMAYEQSEPGPLGWLDSNGIRDAEIDMSCLGDISK